MKTAADGEAAEAVSRACLENLLVRTHLRENTTNDIILTQSWEHVRWAPKGTPVMHLTLEPHTPVIFWMLETWYVRPVKVRALK